MQVVLFRSERTFLASSTACRGFCSGSERLRRLPTAHRFAPEFQVVVKECASSMRPSAADGWPVAVWPPENDVPT